MTPVLGSVVGSTGAVSRSADGRRWVSVGSSAHPDARRAGEAAALRALAGPDPRLLMVFCSLSRDPEMVLAGVAAAGQGVPVIGCSAREMITPAGPSADGVVVAGLGGSGLAVSTGVGFGVADAPREAGAAAASRVADDRADLPAVRRQGAHRRGGRRGHRLRRSVRDRPGPRLVQGRRADAGDSQRWA